MPAKYDESFREELDLLASQFSDSEIAQIIGLNRSNVHLLRKRLNVPSYSARTGFKKDPSTGASAKSFSQKIAFNRQFFKHIDSEEKAYFLGIMMADGCVRTTLACASLEVKRQDEILLVNFCKSLDLSSDHISKRDWILKGKKYPGSSLYLSSKELCLDLVSHGVIAGKQKTTNCFLKTPLEKPLLRAFIRGIFDADGCSTVSFTPKGTIDSSKTSIATASAVFLRQLTSIFVSENIRHKVTTRTRNNEQPLYSINFGAVRTNNFLPWIYKDANIYLKRKHDIWMGVLNQTVRPW